MTSLRVPFNITGGSVADTVDVVKIIEQKIVNTLVTGKYERVMLPEFGAGVQQVLFDDIDELVEVDFKTDASSELTERVSGITIVNILLRQSEGSTATITVYYRTPLSEVRVAVFKVPVGILTEESAIYASV